MDEVEIITLSPSIISMIVSVITHIKQSKCSNCCEIDFDNEDKK